MLDCVTNLKHQVLLTTVYSAGLRISEVVKLQPTDIDSNRKVILVRDGKGNKDRYTLLSDHLLLKLRSYWKLYRPVKWFFPGYSQEKHICTRAAHNAYHLAKKKAGITKEGGIHTLRHCFASHLQENGVDIRIIQKLLGHRHITTTLRYLRISNDKIVSTKSPLDFIYPPQNQEETP